MSELHEEYEATNPSEDSDAAAPGDGVLGYLKAIKIVICADGKLSSHEMEALHKGMEQIGLADEQIAQIEEFDVREVRLEEVLPQGELSPAGARKLLYTTVDTAKADGLYTSEERTAVARVAELLHVDHHTLTAIESLVDIEHAADRMRSTLFLEPKREI